MRYKLPALAAVACALAACQPQPISTADEEAIRASDAAYAAAANSGNVDAMVASYTSDATVQPSGMPPATGTAAIHKMYTDMMAAMRIRLTLTPAKITGQGDVAYETGAYHVVFTMKDSTQAGPPPEDGKYLVVVWRKADKSWKTIATSWSPNAMPTMPAAPARPASRRH